MDPAVRKKQLSAAKKNKDRIVKRYKLRIAKVNRNGPRFYVAKCWMNHLSVVFKTCLYVNRIDPRTNNGIRREIITLNHFHEHKQTSFHQATPKIHHSNFKGRAWYIREYLDGEPQNIKESNFVFQPSFFKHETADWLVNFFAGMHKFSQRFPAKLKKVYAKHTLATNMELIGWHKIPGFVDFPHAAEQIKYRLIKNEALFDNHQSVLTHYEPYASHFFKYGKNKFYIIDWENVDWGNPAHDISVIWNRAFMHPGWQKYLLNNFKKQTLYKKAFDGLFEVEALLQGISNIDYFMRTTHPAEKPLRKKAVTFYQQNIIKILTGKFDPY